LRHLGQLILLRHGESEWNKANRFSGWFDVGLTLFGQQQAMQAGLILAQNGIVIDEAHTSLLSRASDTLLNALSAAGQFEVPMTKTWKLNERHYGAFTGLKKEDVEKKLGKAMLARYRRDYDQRPIMMGSDHPLTSSCYEELCFDYQSSPELETYPRGESLCDCHHRVAEYFRDVISPQLLLGRTILVVAHNNVLRLLMIHVDGVNPRGANSRADIPKAVPIVYHLDCATLQVMLCNII
jgi:2,3-bisphosphoglycerate-dependent phosphoglycerate mutase